MRVSAWQPLPPSPTRLLDQQLYIRGPLLFTCACVCVPVQSRKYPIYCPDPSCRLELGVDDIMLLLQDNPPDLQVGGVERGVQARAKVQSTATSSGSGCC